MKKLLILVLILVPATAQAKPDIRLDGPGQATWDDGYYLAPKNYVTFTSSANISVLTSTNCFFISLATESWPMRYYIEISTSPGVAPIEGDYSDTEYYEKYNVQYIDRKTGEIEPKIFDHTKAMEAYERYAYLLAHPNLYRNVQFFILETKEIIFDKSK